MWNIETKNSCKGTWTHNNLVRKRTINHLAKLAYKVQISPCRLQSVDPL